MRLEDLNIEFLHDFVNINLLKISCLKKEVDFIYDNLIKIAEYNNIDKNDKIIYFGKILNKYLFKNNCYTDKTYIEFFSNNITQNVYSILLNNSNNIVVFSNNIFNILLTSPYLSNEKKTTLYNYLMKNQPLLKTYNNSKFKIKPPLFLKKETGTFRNLNFSLFQNNINFYFYNKSGFNEYNETELDRIQDFYVSSLTNGDNTDYLNMLFNSICYNKDIEVLNETIYYVIGFLKELETELIDINREQDEFIKSTLRNISFNSSNKYFYDDEDYDDRKKNKKYYQEKTGYVFEEEYFDDLEDFKTQEDKDYEYQFNTYIRDKSDVINGLKVGLLRFIKLVLSNEFTSTSLTEENKIDIFKLLKSDINYIDISVEEMVNLNDYYLYQPLNNIEEIIDLKNKYSKNKNTAIKNLLSSVMITENKLVEKIILKSDLKHIDFDYMTSTGVTTNVVVNEYNKNKKEILSDSNLENFYKSLILYKDKLKENNNVFNVLRKTYNITNNKSIITMEMVFSNDFYNKTEEEMKFFYARINELLDECNIFKNPNKSKTKELKKDISLLSDIYNNIFFMYEISKNNYKLYNEMYELLLDLSFYSTMTRNQNGERDFVIKFETFTNNLTTNNKNTDLFTEDNIDFIKEYICNRINITFINEIYFKNEINYYYETFKELISYAVIENELSGILEIIYNEINFEDIYNYNKKSFEEIAKLNNKNIEEFLSLSKNNYFKETSNLFLSINNYDRIIKITSLINKINKNQIKLNF